MPTRGWSHYNLIISLTIPGLSSFLSRSHFLVLVPLICYHLSPFKLTSHAGIRSHRPEVWPRARYSYPGVVEMLGFLFLVHTSSPCCCLATTRYGISEAHKWSEPPCLTLSIVTCPHNLLDSLLSTILVDITTMLNSAN